MIKVETWKLLKQDENCKNTIMFLYRHTQTQISYHQCEALYSLEVITFICILTHFKRGHVCIYEPIKIFFFWVSMNLSHSAIKIYYCFNPFSKNSIAIVILQKLNEIPNNVSYKVALIEYEANYLRQIWIQSCNLV